MKLLAISYYYKRIIKTYYIYFQPEAPLIPTVTSTTTQDSAQESESYCEKICANVYDENDEIICGSDGYMYTGETQLQCYSSCLNISK